MKSKKCATCETQKPIDEFGRAKHQPDGKNKSCKQCCRRAVELRRRKLEFLIKGCPLHLRDVFMARHADWVASAYAEHKRPVVVGNRVMTTFERKNDGFLRKGNTVEKRKKGIVIQTFGSMAHAMRQLRMGYIELKWLSDTGTEKNGFTYKIKES